jgi:hypothetical protein
MYAETCPGLNRRGFLTASAAAAAAGLGPLGGSQFQAGSMPDGTVQPPGDGTASVSRKTARARNAVVFSAGEPATSPLTCTLR